MREKAKISIENDTDTTWDEHQAEKIFAFFLSYISKGEYLRLLQENLDPSTKEKIFTDLRGMCADMVEGYKKRNIKILVRGVKKIYQMQQMTHQFYKKHGKIGR